MEPKFTQRQKKINRLLQKKLSQYFLEIAQREKIPGLIISVTNVRVTKDLSIAKVYLSVFPSEKGQLIMENLEKNASRIKYETAQRFGKEIKRIPYIHFCLDDTLDYIQSIDKAISDSKDSGIPEELSGK